jgi:DNA-binding transcriptional LysR family regulator
VEVGLREGIAADMLRLVAAAELDAAFCLLADDPPPDELAAERVSRDEVVAVFARGRAPSARRVTVADLATHRIVAMRRGSAITSVVEARFANAGEPLRLALESGDPFLMRALAAQGFAAAVLPRSLTRLHGPAVSVRSLDPPVGLPVALVWRRRGGASPAARTFIDFVRDETAT